MRGGGVHVYTLLAAQHLNSLPVFRESLLCGCWWESGS